MSETFEEWLLSDEGRTAETNLCYAPGGGVDYYTASGALYSAYHARDDEIREKDERIAKLEKVVEAAKPFATRLCHPEDWKRLADALSELEGK